MPLVKLKFRPGVDKETTDYENTIGWYDTDKVRFRAGFPENIGGWTPYSVSSFVGLCRTLLPWTALDASEYVAVPTSMKLYVENGGTYNDITPIRATTSLGTDPFSITAASAEVTVTDTAHGAIVGAYVTFSGATSSDGTLTAGVMNAEYPVDSVTDANTYVVTMSAAATGTDSTEGGASVVATYQINPGLDSAVIGTGWGVDTFGSEGWGSASTAGTDVTAQLRLWSMVTFGEDLVANIRNGNIYTWDKSGGVGARAVALADLSGASDAPTVARRILMSPEDRLLLALGCDSLTASGTQDTMLIRWPASESLTNWTPDTDNAAGSLRLNSGSEIITGLVTKRDILIWTDTSLISLTYTGAPYFYGQRAVASNISIASPQAMIEANDITFWMGKDGFYYYDGTVKSLPCTLRSYVFNNINATQFHKVHTGLNSGQSEVWWFYATTTEEIDSYVVFNYEQRIWYHGTMVRTAWIDRSHNDYPIAAAVDNKLYDHEKGLDDGESTPAVAISSHAESSLFEPVPGEGYQYSFVRRILPDLTFTGSEAASPVATITLTPQDYSGGAAGTAVDSTITRATATPETYTKQSHVRVRGREIVYKVGSAALGVRWRDGAPRLEVRPDGRQ
jgi:hypothetical protein